MKRTRGFTLIEVLIAMAVLGILMAVAIPSYAEYVMRGRRAEGRTALNEALQAQERFYAANQRYSAFSPATPNGFATTSGDNPAAASYVLSAAACPGAIEAACVVISATPRAADPQCGTLTLSTNGVRAPAQCWTR